MFDDEKIRLIESLPEADSLLIVWIKLLTLAGKVNAGGYVYLNEDMPYTDEMLSTIFGRSLNIIRLALKTFEKFGMIKIAGHNMIFISNWEKHQNIEGLEKIREQTRLRTMKYREKKQLGKCDVTVTLRDATDIDIDKELDIDKEKSITVPHQQIMDLYNNICTNLPKVKTLNNNRKKAISARWKHYKGDINVFKELFEKANTSDWLIGTNPKNWVADFDWILADKNMPRILEGIFNKRNPKGQAKPKQSDKFAEIYMS